MLLLLIVATSANIKVLVDEKGTYNISINGNLWLRSSHTSLYADNRWYSTDNNALLLTSISTAQGNDPNSGSWNETQLNYDLVRNGTGTKIMGRIRQWDKISAITFHLNTGDHVLASTDALDMNQVRTIFPSFKIEQISRRDQRGYFTFEGKIVFSFLPN